MLDDSVKTFLKKNKIQLKLPHPNEDIIRNKAAIFDIKQLNNTSIHSKNLVKNSHTHISREISKLHPNVHSSIEPKQNQTKMEDKGKANFQNRNLHRQ